MRQTARAARVTDVGPEYRLVIEGPTGWSSPSRTWRPFPQRTERLPISCVEGWSANATWTGVRLGDLLAEAGLARDTEVVVESLQEGGLYRMSTVAPRTPAVRARCWPPGSTDRRWPPTTATRSG